MPLVECVPNFSEGRDHEVLRRITDAISGVAGVTVLDVDPGAATNRTVVTFVGEPEAVVEGAVAGGLAAAEAIDMARHSGEHPRFGAMDVCPLVPVQGITMDEVAELARDVGRRLGDAGLTVYLYEHAATADHRRNLAGVRAGEYEGLEDKLRDPAWQPDFGPAELNRRSGATAVGARDFLVAYNVNLNTTSVRRANAVAFDVREKGRVRDGVRVPGSLKAVKAIGWFIEEYGVAQISMNLTDIAVTPIHAAFDEVVAKAAARGLRVTGSELVGMVPLGALLTAGHHYLRRQQRSLGVSDGEVVRIAVKSLGLDDLRPFVPEEKIIEYRLAADAPPQLVDRTVRGFVHETASESVVPGGGSVAALAGALGAALATMVANLSSHKRGWDDRWEEFSDHAFEGKRLHDELLRLVDEDTAAFDAIIAARRLPKGTDEERAAREAAIAAATRRAIEAPLAVMEHAAAAFPVLEALANEGLSSSASDAGVGALLAGAAVRGAHLNVRTNAPDLGEDGAGYLSQAAEIAAAAAEGEQRVLVAVEDRLG